jgi:hypothetical protein
MIFARVRGASEIMVCARVVELQVAVISPPPMERGCLFRQSGNDLCLHNISSFPSSFPIVRALRTSNKPQPTNKMSASIARAATQAGKTAAKNAEGHVLKRGAKRDPELYVCRASPRMSFRLIMPQVLLAVMSGAFGLAGFYFGNLISFRNLQDKLN